MGYKIDFVDTERNRMKTTWDSAWTIDDAQEYYNAVIIEINKFGGKPWTLMVNQKQFKPADTVATELLKEIGVSMVESGLEKIALIVDDRIAKIQMTRVALQSGLQKLMKFSTSEEEARIILGWD
jgi:predicted component of type VI protein secretion system